MHRVFFPEKRDCSRRGEEREREKKKKQTAIDNDQTRMTNAFLFQFCFTRMHTLSLRSFLTSFLSVS